MVYTTLLNDNTDFVSFDFSRREDLEQIPIEPYESNPYVEVLELSNISTGGPNIFEIIFDNVEGVSGDFYTGYYLGQEWEFRDDMLYIFQDSNRNSTIDQDDELLIETNLGNDYSDFGGIPDDGGSNSVYRIQENIFLSLTNYNSLNERTAIFSTEDSYLIYDVIHTNNSILSDSGNNELIGSNSNDWIEGSNNNDLILGGSGNDVLLGNLGNDVIRGGSSKDIIYGGLGQDKINGGNGQDRILGAKGKDKLFGEEGNDFLSGGKGHDVMDAGVGNDLLTGGLGNDKLIGGSGRDTAIFGSGNNKIDLALTERQETGEGRDLFSSIENVKGGDGDDLIRGNSLNNYLYGENDNDRLFGRDGKDRLYGESGNDRLLGEAGNDILFGGDGNDFLNGGLGNDQLTGGAGRDKFCISTGNGRDVIKDYGNGNDRIKLLGGLTESDLTFREVGGHVRIKYEGDLMAIVQDTLIADLSFI